MSNPGNGYKGYGNNGEDGSEGAIYKNVYCSYSHGSLLLETQNLQITDLSFAKTKI